MIIFGVGLTLPPVVGFMGLLRPTEVGGFSLGEGIASLLVCGGFPTSIKISLSYEEIMPTRGRAT